MAEPTGLSAVLAETDAGSALVDDAEQLALEIGLTIPEQKRGVGRPAGRRNRRTEAVASYLLSRYRDPLEGLVQMAAMPLDALAAALGCTRLDAFQEKRQCMIAALPYLHQRQPIAVDLTAKRAVSLSIVVTPPDGQADEAMDGAVTIIGEIVQNQYVSDGADDAV